MKNEIIEIKAFNPAGGTIQPSAVNGNGHDYSTRYATINGNRYNYGDLEVIVGVEHDGSLCNVADKHLSLFTEEESKGFFSIN